MSSTRWVTPRALSLSCLLLLLHAATASAQFFSPVPPNLDMSASDVSLSPRLLGMGGLSMVIPDRHYSYSLWDFARIPVAIAADDSTSTIDLIPGTDAASSQFDLQDGRTRQNLAARSTGAEAEAVYRSRESGGVFGLVGNLNSLRFDEPVATQSELRQGLVHPQALAILGGVLPRFFDHHVRWGMHLRFVNETVDRQYREIVSNAAGDFIDLGGGELPPPSEFEPTKVDVNSTAYGLSGSYDLGKHTHIALGIERENIHINATNDLDRSSSEVQETRPYWNGQAAMTGLIGKTFEWGVNGIGRQSNSQADWRFTASAGVGGVPLQGRGDLLTRDEKSSELHAQARWTPGRASFSGSFQTAASKVLTDPPNANDATSLNRFINEAYNRPGADTLALPDSVVHGDARRYAWGWAGGASYRFKTTTVGGEFHWSRDIRSTIQLGSGPKRIAWDIRTGLEHPLGKVMTGRLGYDYSWVDQDDFTANNEYAGSAFSLGLGYAPPGASWVLESGYRMAFRSQDFNGPNNEHQNRQNLGVEVHWVF